MMGEVKFKQAKNAVVSFTLVRRPAFPELCDSLMTEQNLLHEVLKGLSSAG